jgi:adenosylcobinamide kinase/adenosylcobinamide-phosphate guanylyltransferase
MTWTTVEEPLALTEWLNKEASSHTREIDPAKTVVLLDCLTLWLTNWLMLEDEDGTVDVQAEIERLVDAVSAFPGPLLIVTNEVGDGIVPSYPLGRRFRDEAGRLNQRVAAACERVFLVTSGIPVDLRAIAFRFEEES